ncbi:hypothetical protein GBL97_15575 [Yersinia pseudotuberculosis]|uniref:hypothetical protein n=1 Tax=Yersinia pseudotuberculosis TaxID=633 RepID=UPI001A9F4A29|nr:hypothetical protein [Yersinia pseudotuberculosis]MBO1567072.1 hypothetical protein [Yersinia pseudotuberculosis]MBO1603931.1 hypothetical protein [Yersinia pseudotuberculosis]
MSITIYIPKYLHSTQRKVTKSFSHLWWNIFASSCDKNLHTLHNGHQYILATGDVNILTLWKENNENFNKLKINLDRVIRNDIDNIVISHKSLGISPALYTIITQGFKSDLAQSDPMVIKSRTNEMLQRQDFLDNEAQRGYTLYVD